MTEYRQIQSKQMMLETGTDRSRKWGNFFL